MAEIRVRFSQTTQSIGARVTEGGLSEIFHDETLEGKGTSANPLGVAESVLQDIDSRVEKTAEAEKVYGTDENGDQTTYDLDSFGKVDDVQVNGESVVENKVADITIGNATITLQKNGTDVDSFTTNATQNKSINITVPTQASDVGALPDTTTINDLTTEAQQNALNSGITSAGVSQITTNKNDIATINGKIPATASSSNKLTDKSYVDGEISSVENDIATINGKIPSAASSSNQLTDKAYVDGEITTVEGDIADINAKIPEQASASNKLADKNFVNSSISTNTANFIGTFNSVAELEAYSGTVTNNDYAFVISEDSVGNTVYNRYKYTTATTPASWLFEYALNNSSFTADQWAAINSGATTTNIGQIATNTTTISGHIANKNNPHEVTKTQVGLGNVDNTSDADKPVSTATQTALDAKADKTNRINGAPLSNTTSSFYGTSDTAAATAQKEVSIPSITNLDVGTIIIVQPTATSSVANSTIKLNNFDAYPMRYNNAAITTTTDSIVWNSSYPSTFVFNGTYWVFAGHGVDSDTTYTLNYSLDQGFYRAGSGTYAITRYSLILQKPNGTWEKTTSTSSTYSTDTNKTVNTNGFILNQIRYYGTTNTVASGGRAATNTVYQKSSQVDMRYSTNCGETTTWTVDEYVYLVGSMGADGLFYLDTTQWWTNALPTTNDGKLYIRLGLVLSNSGYVISFFDDRPIFYHNGTVIKEYKVADNKQDVISDLATIRSGAAAGSTAVQSGDLATVATTGNFSDLNNKPTTLSGYGITDAYTKTETNTLLNAKASTSLDNLTDTGANIANWSHNVSNCLIEVPQDINLTLSDGTLTLKAGSKLTFPNGTTSVITADKTGSTTSSGELVIMATSSGAFSLIAIANCTSGTTDSKAGTPYHCWLDTTNNVINYYGSDGTTVSNTRAFPLGIVTATSGTITSIDQVFNGFGYMGSSFFYLPGIKVLSANGFNADGTVKSTLSSMSSVYIKTYIGATTDYIAIGADRDFYAPYYEQTTQPSTSGLWYNPETNLLLRSTDNGSTWAQRREVVVATITTGSGGVVSSLSWLKKPLRLVEYNDFADLQTTVENKADKETTLAGYGITDAYTKSTTDTLLNVKADTSLSNLTATGANIANWSHNVSNCITEIPQDITLSLSSGTLTLKSGSKGTKPNGSTIITTVDITRTSIGAASTDVFLFITSETNIEAVEVARCYSRNTAPTVSGSATWFDTANNVIKRTTDSGATWTIEDWSFPIAIISRSSGTITSIKQVFNGFGYLGRAIFALPGVKVLVPNGRNDDGSLKSQLFELTTVLTSGYYFGDETQYFGFNRTDGVGAFRIRTTIYDEAKNTFSFSPNTQSTLPNCVLCGIVTYSSDAISYFKPFSVAHAVDYNDSEYMAHCAMPGTKYTSLTLGASGTGYTAPADGYIALSSTFNTNGYLYMYRSGTPRYGIVVPYITSQWVDLCIPVAKGQGIIVQYNGTASVQAFNFIYANGAV